MPFFSYHCNHTNTTTVYNNMENKQYKEQAKEIEELAAKIVQKAHDFANKEHNSQYYGDLLHVLEDLESSYKFLNGE